jgi:Flp pilus assembly protein TadG
MHGMIKKKWGDQRGVAAIEFALVLPILLILVFGIIEFSTILYDKAMITNASREGARLGIVYRYDPETDSSGHPTTQDIIDRVNIYLQNHLISLGSPSNAAETLVDKPNGDVSGQPLEVTVNYTYQFLVLPNFIATLTGGLNLSAVTIMRME